MAFRSAKNGYASNSIPTSKTEIIAASDKKRIIRKATFTNTTGGVVVVDLYIDPTGSSEIHIVDTKSLADAETYTVPDIEGHVLEAAGTIDVTSDTASVGLIITVMEALD